MEDPMQRPVPPAVVALALFVVFSIIGYFMWRANQPSFPAASDGRSAAMAKLWQTSPSFRRAMLKAHPGMKGPKVIAKEN
ncbi:MAG: hypothetical protein LC772_05640 [Chloroflexi bacterium]|nr:hypothetical protein [Chloroflexota bacterium]